MSTPHAYILQRNHRLLKHNLQVNPVLDALYEKCIFTHADYDRCRHADRVEKIEVFLEIVKMKEVEAYKTMCAELEKSQPFIKKRLDATASEEGYSDLIYVNKGKLEAQYKRELDEKDIAALHTEIEELQVLIKEKDKANAEQKGKIKKERAELISQIEKKNGQIVDLHTEIEVLQVENKQIYKAHSELKGTSKNERAELKAQNEKQDEEVEALKTELSKTDADLQQTKADCEELKKRLQEEQEAYDALVGAPRSQSPDWVDNTEQVKHAGSEEGVCQFLTQSCCDEYQLCLLPCLHSACKPCLDQQAAPAKQKYIQCPSCGREFTMEQTTVDHVRRNEAAYSENVDKRKKCNYDKQDHSTPAVVYCHECNARLCSNCHNMHDKLKPNQNHRVSEINQAENISVRHCLEERNCRDHPGNKLQLYDHTCKMAVCRVCVHGAHKRHRKEDLNQAYDLAKGRLEEQVKKQQYKLQDVTARMETVTSQRTKLGNTQRRLEQTATKAYKSVCVKFLHRQKQLMEEIQVSLQLPYKLVQEKLNTLHDVRTSIVSAIDYTQRTLKSTRREELIILTDVLQTKCDETLKRKLSEDDTQDRKILLTFQGQKALMELIDTFGGVASSLNVDDIPDKQPTLQDLQKWNMQLTLKEEDTRKFIIRAFVPSESPECGLYLKGYSGTMHIISKKRDSKLITCPKLQMNAGRANTDRCHVTTAGELLNSPPATQHTGSGRLQRLKGTCSSTIITLTPSPSSVTPIPHTTRYWEAHTMVDVWDGVWWGPVLEVGVGEERQVDSEGCVNTQRRSWCVRVGRCRKHRGSLCTRVWCRGQVVGVCRNTMSAPSGIQATFHYGVVLDVGRGRIGFIDLERSAVLGKVDVKFKEDLLPVFTVGPWGRFIVKMKVVSGEEILMSDTKKSLINEVQV